MSFRKEIKLDIHKNKLFNFKNFLLKNKIIKIFEDRIVSSIYFDNKNFDCYEDSIEGSVPRKKIRVRYYNNDSKNLNLEKKISSAEGRFKISKKIEKKINFPKFIIDSNYGICYPVAIVTYRRSYFKINNIRVTLDKDICYKNYNTHAKVFDDRIVAEIKCDIDTNDDLIENIFPFEKIRFSKYTNSIDSLIIKK